MALVEINLRPDKKHLDGFGVGIFVLFGLLGGLIWWKGGFLFWDFPGSAAAVATVLWAVAGLCAADSLAGYLLRSRVQPVNRPVYLLVTVVGYPIGFVLSLVLLGLLFYGMLTPLGLAFRLLGRDPLKRKFEPDAKTYWEPHRPPRDTSRYFKQY